MFEGSPLHHPFSQAAPAGTSTTPTPPYRNEGSRPFPQTPFALQGRGLTAPPVALILASSTHQRVGIGFSTAVLDIVTDLGIVSEPLSKGRRQQGCRKSGEPRRGESLRSQPKPLKIGGFCDFQLHPPHIGGTDGAARGKLSSLKLSRVATEEDEVKSWRGWMSLGSFSAPENEQLGV